MSAKSTCRQPEYYQEFQSVRDLGSFRQLTWGGQRQELTEEYAWAIPNETAVQYLADESVASEIVEVGAGNGYWAYEIERHGGCVHPIDIEPPNETWVEVVEASYEDLNRSEVDQLFLCWPPANSSMAADCVKHLSPQTIHFVGVDESSVTGDEQFHRMLHEQYENLHQIPLPSWTDTRTALTTYER